jgi:hypothetical protein
MPETWTITTDSGPSATGYLPAWAEADPSADKVPLALFGSQLADLTHHKDFDGRIIRHVSSPGGTGDGVVLVASISCTPYAEEPERRAPFATVSIIGDHFIDGLDPDGLAELITALEAQTGYLRSNVLPALEHARRDWISRVSVC